MKIQRSKCSLQKRPSGFTLVELLLYMGIFSLLLVFLLWLFTSVVDVGLRSESDAAITQDARYLITRFNYDIQRASNIATPAVGSQSATLNLVISGTTYIYALSSGILSLTVNGQTDALNSSNTLVTNLLFSRYGRATGNSAVKAGFTLTSTVHTKSGVQSTTFETISTTRSNQ